MNAVLEWLMHLPLALLYPTLAVVAMVENVFPPIPADTVVALGSWLAGRGEGSAVSAFLATWLGNVGGAAGKYQVGRQQGSAWMHRRFPSLGNELAEARLAALYDRYGIAALVMSRFVPGARALVPPFAGALRVPPVKAIGAIAIASAIWYGGISYLAFHATEEVSVLLETVRHSGRIVAIVASGILVVGAGVWWVRHHRVRT